MKLPMQAALIVDKNFRLSSKVATRHGNVTAAKALQSTAGSGSGKVGKSCKVTEGPNEGKTGTYTEEEGEGIWCEGDWGGTQCTGSKGDTGKCEDAVRSTGASGRVVIFDGSIARLFA